MLVSFLNDRITTMQSKISRRAVVKGGLIAGALIPAMGLVVDSAAAAGCSSRPARLGGQRHRVADDPVEAAPAQ